MAGIYEKNACVMIFYPGAFEPITGLAHWELLIRTRSIDNQCYVIANAPACNPKAEFKIWGHSTVSDPFGEIIAKAGHDEEIVYADISNIYFLNLNNFVLFMNSWYLKFKIWKSSRKSEIICLI